MNILIVGSGLLGRMVAQDLDKLGHEVSIIDDNEDNLLLLPPSFGGVTSVGFPMDISNLKKAGIEGCDAVAVITADDNLNITVGQIAKSIFKVEKVIARISDPYREHIFESFGLQTVCPTNMAGTTIISALVSSVKNRTMSYGTSSVSFDVRKPAKGDIGKPLKLVLHREEESIFGIIDKDENLTLWEAGANIVLGPEDSIVYVMRID